MGIAANIKDEYFIGNSFGDQFFYSINRNQFREQSAKDAFKKKYADVLENENQLSVFVGTDSGLLPHFFSLETLPQGARILFLELPEVYDRLHLEGVFDALGKHVVCRAYSRKDQLENANSLGLDEHLHVDRVKQYLSYGASADYLSTYQDLSLVVQETIAKEKNRLSASLGYETFFMSQLNNVADNLHPIDCFKGAFKGKTAVILGGGPSLDEFLPWLLENRRKVAVIAVSRVSRKLIEVGLSPDFVVCIDPQDVSYIVSKEMFLLNPPPILLHANHVNHSIVGQWPYRKFYCGQLFPWDSRLNESTVPVSGPTVTNQALAVAKELGFSQALLTGVDLCYDKQGFSHASGSYEHQSGPHFTGQQIWVETNEGGVAATNFGLEQAIYPLSLTAQDAVENGCRVVNLSAVAAKVDFVDYQPIEEVVIDSLNGSCNQLVEEILPAEGENVSKAHLQAVEEELSEAKADLIKIGNFSKRALGLVQSYGRYDDNRKDKCRNDIDKIERNIVKNHSNILNFIKQVGIKKLLKITSYKNEHQNDNNYEEIIKIYYGSICEVSDELKNLLDKVLKRVRSRREEITSAPKIDDILDQWEADRTLGRVNLCRKKWQQRDCRISVDSQQRIDSFRNRFEKEIGTFDDSFFSLKKTNANPAFALSKARLAFRKENKMGLQQLLEGLSLIDNPEALEASLLIKGYIAEIEHQLEPALNCYGQILGNENQPKFLEDVLQRVALVSLRLNDFENALAALECLASLSPAYMVQYANLLKMNGDVESAVNVYTDYLEHYPKDTSVMMSLAVIYQDQGLAEGVALMAKLILQENPDHQAARQLLQAFSVNGLA